MITGESNFDEKSVQLPRVAFILNESPFQTNQNNQQISWENKSGFVDSGFVKTCDELVIGSMEERFSFVEETTSSYTSTTMKLELK